MQHDHLYASDLYAGLYFCSQSCVYELSVLIAIASQNTGSHCLTGRTVSPTTETNTTIILYYTSLYK